MSAPRRPDATLPAMVPPPAARPFSGSTTPPPSRSIRSRATRASRKEKRKERLGSATPEDNRITHGCINVSPNFYAKIVQPTFQKGGVFYVIPDSGAVQVAFPAFLPASQFASAEDAQAVSFTRPPPKPTKKRAPKAPSKKPQPEPEN